jgi:hypothetical protein
LPYRTGLFLEVVSGSIEGTVQVLSADEWEGGGMPVIVLGSVTVEVQ